MKDGYVYVQGTRSQRNLSESPGVKTLVELARKRASGVPDGSRAYTFLTEGGAQEEILTFRDLDLRARRIAGYLQSLSRRGDRAVLFFHPGLDYIAAFFGCLYAGLIAVPSYPPKFQRNHRKIVGLFEDCGARIVLSTGTILNQIAGSVESDELLRTFDWVDIAGIGPEWEGHWTDPEARRGDIAFLQYTSGSTSQPKGVMVTHGNLLENLRVIHDSFGESEGSQGVIWLPPYHDMGLIGGILVPLYGHFPVALMSPFSFLQKPLAWLAAISRLRANSSGGPDFAYELCVQKITDEQKASLDLSCWKVAFNGAEPIRRQTMDRFYEAFKGCGFRKEAFFPCYGLAEATLYVTGARQGQGFVCRSVEEEGLRGHEWRPAGPGEGRSMVGSGKAFSGETLRIVDPETLRASPSGRIGEIWVRSASVAKGYWNKPELTASTFAAFVEGEGPFLRTGDLGILQDGELFVTGRIKDLIILRGRNYYPQDLELTAEKAHAVLCPLGGAAFSRPVGDEERLFLVFETRRGVPLSDVGEVFRAVRDEILASHELALHTLVLIRPMSLPKTTSGKVQRRLTQERLLAGELEILGQASEEEPLKAAPGAAPENWGENLAANRVGRPAGEEGVVEILRTLAVRTLRIEAAILDAETPLNGFGFDSLMAVSFCHAAETEFGVPVAMELVLGGLSLGQLGREIQGLIAASAERRPAMDAPSGAPAMTRRADGSFPLSHNQRSLWFMSSFVGGEPVFHLAFSVRLSGRIELSALRETFEELVRFNPALRTRFQREGAEIFQVADRSPEIEEIDASRLSERETEELLDARSRAPFDLMSGPLTRLVLLRENSGGLRLHLVVHHLVTDFWSLTVLAREWGLVYGQKLEGREDYRELLSAKRSYAEHVERQAARLAGSPDLLEFWKAALSGELPVLNLATDLPRPAVRTYRGASEFLPFDGPTTDRLRRLCTETKVTIFTALLSVFKVLLGKYTGQSDLLVGTLTSGRRSADFADVMGYFVNPVVLRSDLSEDPVFSTFLERVGRTVLRAFEHQDLPFDILVQSLKLPRDLSRTPVFQTMFVYQGTVEEEWAPLSAFALNETETSLTLGPLTLTFVPSGLKSAQYDLTLVASPTGQGLGISFQYNSDLFRPETIRRMTEHFKILLAAVLDDPRRRLSELPILTEAERSEILERHQGPIQAYESLCLHTLIERQARKTPGRTAVRHRGLRLTYADLDERANRLAQHLTALGLQVGQPVALCLERGPELVITLLAILKAGGCYLPLDPLHPAQRMSLILDDAKGEGSLFVVTQERFLDRFEGCSGSVLCLDRDRLPIAAATAERPRTRVGPDDPAYTIYTSGSTGRPKGVSVPHRSVVNFLESMRLEPGLGPDDVLLAVTTISFDIAALELYLPLVCGAQVVIAEEGLVLDGPALSRVMEESGATVMQATPSLWRLLLDSGWPGRPSLRALCGGEAFPPELAARLLERTREVWNMYGPTETTIWSTVFKVDGRPGPIPLGRPIANTRVYILDAFLRPVPRGVSGELFIGGDGVALGYFRRPELTAERFLADPFSPTPGGRMYRTGDLARFLEGGLVEFLGRLDHQVKIRGYRIEIGEIEAALNAHQALAASLVVALDGPAGEKQLGAYLIASGQRPGIEELRRFLKARLPESMIPAHFLFLDSFPRTPNGKIDRKALPVPENVRPELESGYLAPRGEAEKTIVQVWTEVLKLQKIGVNDNFFDLGGSSILLAQVYSLIRERFPEKDFSIVELFRLPTVASFSAWLSGDGTEASQREARETERIETRKALASQAHSQRELRKKIRTERDS